MPLSEIEFTRNLNLWCDGIPFIQIQDIHRTAFTIGGVGYFPHQLSPFEVGFHFNRRRDLDPSRITLKFGILDRSGPFFVVRSPCTKVSIGQVRTFPMNKDPGVVFSHRPQRLEDWAVAVEFSA